MKLKIRNRWAHLPILRKGGVHGKTEKAQRALDKVCLKKHIIDLIDKLVK